MIKKLLIMFTFITITNHISGASKELAESPSNSFVIRFEGRTEADQKELLNYATKYTYFNAYCPNLVIKPNYYLQYVVDKKNIELNKDIVIPMCPKQKQIKICAMFIDDTWLGFNKLLGYLIKPGYLYTIILNNRKFSFTETKIFKTE